MAKRTLLFLGLLVLCASCSGQGQEAADPQGTASQCPAVATDLLDRLDEFIAPYSELSAEEFLASESLDGLSEFQDAISETMVDSSGEPRCLPGPLEDALTAELENYSGQGLVADFLVDMLRSGGQRSVRDVVVEPGDDLGQIVALLDTGSSLTFTAGTFDVATTILVSSGITLQGAGIEQTTINSSAPDAALAVFDGGALTIADLALSHVGTAPASVLLAFDSELRLSRVRVSGGMRDADGAGGSGVILSDAASAETDTDGRVTMTDVEIVDNAQSGIVVTTGASLSLSDSTIARNGACGVCYFENASGTANGNVIDENSIGIQVADAADPVLANNEIVNNALVGVLVGDMSSPTVIDNVFEQNGESAIEARGESRPIVHRNSIGAHEIGMSYVGASRADLVANKIVGSSIGLQVGEQANVTARANEYLGTTVIGMLLSGDSTGTYSGSQVDPEQGAGVLVNDSADPTIDGLSVTGGDVAVAFVENATGALVNATISGANVGIEVRDSAAPTVSASNIRDTTSRAVIFSAQAAGEFVNNTISESPQLAIQLSGMADPSIEGNTIDGSEVAIAIVDTSTATVSNNQITGADVGVDVGGEANPTIENNQLLGSVSAGMVFRDNSTGQVIGNTIVEVGSVGIQVTGTASPTIADNTLGADEPSVDLGSAEAPTSVGVLYSEGAAGTASGNMVFNFLVGFQIADNAAPELVANVVDGGPRGDVGFVYRDASAGSALDNQTTDHLIGFQLTDRASPALTANIVLVAEQAAFLLADQVTASLEDNECPVGVVGIAIIDQANPTVGPNQCEVVRG